MPMTTGELDITGRESGQDIYLAQDSGQWRIPVTNCRLHERPANFSRKIRGELSTYTQA
jgi:hypothetical protein